MRESIKNPESLAVFPLLFKLIKNFEEGEREAKMGKNRNPNLRSVKLTEALEQFPDLAPTIEFLLNPSNSETDRIAKIEEINSKSINLNAGVVNTVSFESGSGRNITLSYINNGKFSLSYPKVDKNK